MHIMADRSVCLPSGGIEVELYAVTACGYRCYFLGALTDEAVDSFCAHAGIGAADEVPQALLLSGIGGEDQTRYEKVQLLSKSGDLRVLACAGDLSDVRAFRAGLRQTRTFLQFWHLFLLLPYLRQRWHYYVHIPYSIQICHLLQQVRLAFRGRVCYHFSCRSFKKRPPIRHLPVLI